VLLAMAEQTEPAEAVHVSVRGCPTVAVLALATIDAVAVPAPLSAIE
jgi:hypothetical protein